MEITPELAATVVKDYLLPMFDTDGRKLLKRKSKVSSFSFAPESKPLENSSGLESAKPKTVYEELKLTMVLQNEIYQLK